MKQLTIILAICLAAFLMVAQAQQNRWWTALEACEQLIHNLEVSYPGATYRILEIYEYERFNQESLDRAVELAFDNWTQDWVRIVGNFEGDLYRYSLLEMADGSRVGIYRTYERFDNVEMHICVVEGRLKVSGILFDS